MEMKDCVALRVTTRARAAALFTKEVEAVSVSAPVPLAQVKMRLGGKKKAYYVNSFHCKNNCLILKDQRCLPQCLRCDRAAATAALPSETLF